MSDQKTAFGNPDYNPTCPFCGNHSVIREDATTWFGETCAEPGCGYGRYVVTDYYEDEEPWLERWC